MFVIPKDISAFLNKNCPKHSVFVVGVSGGADSLYLAFILKEFVSKNGGKVLTATVDHGLRPEAAKEAEWVHKVMEKHKIPHTILKWTGPKPHTRIEERAREKRYQLLIDYAHAQKANALCLAHHQQDQIETFWARLAHTSGLDGLTAMHTISQRQGCMLLRPLLNMPKAQIIAELKKNKIKWVEDPMNQDTLFERVRWRKNQDMLDKMGLTAPKIEQSIKRLQRAKEALDFYADKFILNHVHFDAHGYICFSQELFQQLPMEIQIRVVLNLLKQSSPLQKVISLESVENMLAQCPTHATLSGCQWVISKKQIFIAQELKYLSKTTIPAHQKTIWGNCRLWTNTSFQTHPQAPKPRLQGIPYLIQRTFPVIPAPYRLLTTQKTSPHLEKELEKKLKIDYKDKAPVVYMEFDKHKG